jgi:predicted nucleic acid-binding protein
MRLFLDANILFTAAHNLRGKAILVIELGDRGYWELFSSPYALEEARRNLERKFPHVMDELGKFQHGIRPVEHRADLAFPKDLSTKDRPIFQAALACQATHLLTGDLNHFGRGLGRLSLTLSVITKTHEHIGLPAFYTVVTMSFRWVKM